MAVNPSVKNHGKLLSPADFDACTEIVSMDILPSSKRAEVLLLLNRGVTQKNASIETELSLGQVRYALSLFKESGMAMFPEMDNVQVAEQEVPEELVVDVEEDVVEFEVSEPLVEKEYREEQEVKKDKVGKKKGKKNAKKEKNKIAKKARKIAKKKKKKKKKK
ncbi:MAG: hypothetical protein OCC45_11345 [Desulfotalea sp.]